MFDPAVITIARISGGTTNNIIPETVEIEGTIRTVSPATRVAALEIVRRVAAGVGATHGTDGRPRDRARATRSRCATRR